ncbi:Ephrin-B3 [Liparis tanakae]|uniref:Ephrin-B3 n=1 Tax=Liparis tanakae TaxID=230148 RepID=A0A4Z2E2B7_9TELE|nr:Ephrin-B3 [Liparis tanakae]
MQISVIGWSVISPQFFPLRRFPRSTRGRVARSHLCVCVCVQVQQVCEPVLTLYSIFLSSSSRFRDDKGYVLYPQIGDRLDLICPPQDVARSTPEYEFYKLYLVSVREQADRCEVSGPPNIVLTCDEPARERRFTIKFQEFSPNLWGHEFKTMHDYYIIAWPVTADGEAQFVLVSSEGLFGVTAAAKTR